MLGQECDGRGICSKRRCYKGTMTGGNWKASTKNTNDSCMDENGLSETSLVRKFESRPCHNCFWGSVLLVVVVLLCLPLRYPLTETGSGEPFSIAFTARIPIYVCAVYALH